MGPQGRRWPAVVGLLFAQLIGQCCGLYARDGPVEALTPGNFDSKLRGGVWLVEFYAPWCGHCQALKPTWEQVAGALKGIINVGAVDADAHKELAGQYKIQGFPTIKFMYTSGDGKIGKVDYNGGRSTEEIIDWAMSQAKKVALKRAGAKGSGSGSGGGGSKGKRGGGGSGFYGSSSDVQELGSDNFEEEVLESQDLWMVEFYAPWCGHCKNLKPAWEEAAGQLRGKIKVGAVNCDEFQSLCGQYGVQGFPTIKFFGNDKQSPEDYQGGRDMESIVDFGNNKWTKVAPPPEVKELTDQYIFDQNCLGDEETKKGQRQLCFITFLPHILDSRASGRQQYLDTLLKVGEKFKGRPFSYLWAEGGKQPNLEKNVDVGGYGYPALIAFNPAKQKFAAMRYSFDFDHIVEFINGLRQGFEKSLAVNGGLADIETVSAWDGSDGAEEMEDEFDLDDIMNEEL